MPFVLGTIHEESVVNTLHEMPLPVCSTAGVHTRKRFSKKAFLVTVLVAICQGKMSGWTRNCAVRCFSSYRNDMATKMVILTVILKQASGAPNKTRAPGSVRLSWGRALDHGGPTRQNAINFSFSSSLFLPLHLFLLCVLCVSLHSFGFSSFTKLL